jgi:hypothetical protein
MLSGLGARQWQVDLTGPVLVSAILEAEVDPPADDVDDLAD